MVPTLKDTINDIHDLRFPESEPKIDDAFAKKKGMWHVCSVFVECHRESSTALAEGRTVHLRFRYRHCVYKQSSPTMSETHTLLCWVIDTPIKRIFAVKIKDDELWSGVKDAIKKKKKPDFDDIAADTLDLWKMRHCAISHVVMHNSQRLPSIVPNVNCAWDQKITWRG